MPPLKKIKEQEIGDIVAQALGSLNIVTEKEVIVEKPITNIDELKDIICDRIDADTHAAILDLADDNQQKNNLALYNYYLEKKLDGTITEEESAAMQALKAVWEQINFLRALGNAKEAKIMLCTGIDQVQEIEMALKVCNTLEEVEGVEI